MKDKDKDIERLIDKVMKDHTLQAPSFDFTSKVMVQVAAQRTRTSHYQPMISKTAWGGIFGSILIICIYALTDATQQASPNTIELGFLYNNRLSEAVAKIHFSEVTMYAVLVLTFLIFIQIPLLKNHFGRKGLD